MTDPWVDAEHCITNNDGSQAFRIEVTFGQETQFSNSADFSQQLEACQPTSYTVTMQRDFGNGTTRPQVPP